MENKNEIITEEKREEKNLNSENNQKICYICDMGAKSKKILDSYEFNDCHHYYCVYCFFRDIFLNHIDEFIEQNEIIVKCKCNKGKKKFTLDEIDNLIKLKSEKKEDEEKSLCKKHDLKCDLFCKNCQKYICFKCNSDHETHKIVQNNIFIRMYKDFIKGMPLKFKYPENFKLNFDESVEKFNKQLTEKTNSAIKKIDELIEELKNIRKNYFFKLKEIQENGLQSINLIKSFYYEYYSDLYNIKTDNDIYSLSYLASFKKELNSFEMKFNQGIFPKLDGISNNVLDLKGLIEQPFSLKMNFIDIPTTFREVIRTIGHDDEINCLTRIGDSQFISGSNDNSIKFWNLEDEELRPYECIDKFIGKVGCILLLKDNRLCFSSLKDGSIKICKKIRTFNKEELNNSDDSNYNVELTLEGHTKPITGIIQLDNNNLVTVSKDDKIIIWKMGGNYFVNCFEMKEVHKSKVKEEGGVYSLCKIEKNDFITGGADGKIKFWKKNLDNEEYICIQEIGQHNNKVKYLISLEDKNICSASDDGYVKVFTKKGEKFEFLWEKEYKDEKITTLAGLKNGIFITGSLSTKQKIYANMRVWEKNGDYYIEKENIKKHLKRITAIVELDWGNVVSSDSDGVIIVWKSGILYD